MSLWAKDLCREEERDNDAIEKMREVVVDDPLIINQMVRVRYIDRYEDTDTVYCMLICRSLGPNVKPKIIEAT